MIGRERGPSQHLNLFLNRQSGNVSSGEHRHGSSVHGGDQFWCAVFADFGCALYGANPDVQKFSRVSLRHSANWRKVRPRTLLHVSDSVGHHSPLAFRQVPPVQVQAHHEADRIAAAVVLETRLKPRL